MDGKKIAEIYFEGGPGNFEGSPARIVSAKGTTLHLSATFHGDHDQFWVIESRDGKEVARHAVRSIASIYWLSA